MFAIPIGLGRPCPRCEYCGGDVEGAAEGARICNADRGPNDEGPAFIATPITFDRVPCNICGDTMTLDTGSRRPLADGAGWDGAVCADCTGGGR